MDFMSKMGHDTVSKMKVCYFNAHLLCVCVCESFVH